MTSRAARIERLHSLRERELSDLTAQLSRAKARLTAAQADTLTAVQRLEAARQSQRNLATVGGNGQAFSQAEEWVYHNELQLELTRNAARRAEREVQRCGIAVRAAHQRLEQIKLLAKRLAARAQAEQRKAERREEDEVASRTMYRSRR